MKPSRFDFSAPLGISLAGLALVIAFLVTTMPGVLGALFARSTEPLEPQAVQKRLLAAHDNVMETYQKRIDGRSLFFDPKPLPRPAPPKPAVVRQPDPDPEPEIETTPPPLVDTTPKAPPSYTGPSPRAITLDTVWFPDERETVVGDLQEPLRIRVGQEKNGIGVLEILGPNMVRLAHRGGEYDVTIFDGNASKILEQSVDNSTIPEGLVVVNAVRTDEESDQESTLEGIESESLNPTSEPKRATPRDNSRSTDQSSSDDSSPARSNTISRIDGPATDDAGRVINDATEIPADVNEIVTADGRRIRVARRSVEDPRAALEKDRLLEKEAQDEMETQADDDDPDGDEGPRSDEDTES
ncbi:MAG: hypothetical protein AAF432_04755 [Planctomycetota bacterium]